MGYGQDNYNKRGVHWGSCTYYHYIDVIYFGFSVKGTPDRNHYYYILRQFI